jgi:hypothetical protein
MGQPCEFQVPRRAAPLIMLSAAEVAFFKRAGQGARRSGVQGVHLKT